jgi:hypothetical protein
MNIYKTDYSLDISEKRTHLTITPLDDKSIEVELDDDREVVRFYLDLEAAKGERRKCEI